MRFILGWKRGKSHYGFRIIGILLVLAFHSAHAGPFSGRVAGRWLAPAHMSSEPAAVISILKGFTFQGGQWVGGFILDPESGREFRSEISTTGDPKRLKVRGYMGWKWLGKDIYWTRLE